jgi:hypothetical protein
VPAYYLEQIVQLNGARTRACYTVTNLTEYKNRVLCKGTKMYNSLPTYIKEASTNTKKFPKS